MSDPSAPPMPGESDSTTEIVQRASSITAHAIEVMPLMSDGEIKRAWRVANALAQSRMFKDVHQAEQAFAKILLGRDLGLSPTQAMTGIHIVEGKPELAATTLAAFVRRKSGYDYKVQWRLAKTREWVEDDNGEEVDGCKVIFTVDGEVRGVSTFTAEDSKRAGLLDRTGRNGGVSNHKRYPRNMFFARAMSNGVKFHVPEALGGVPVYFEGEIAASSSDQPVPQENGDRPQQNMLPDELRDLVRRAAAVDSRAWRENEVLARLPPPDVPGYRDAVRALVGEVQAWLDEHEPTDAEVVGGEADPAAECQRRWENDPEWRARVQQLLNAYADADGALAQVVAAGEGDDAEADARHRLREAEKALADAGVPAGWFPESPKA